MVGRLKESEADKWARSAGSDEGVVIGYGDI
jgi:hypothetical protein